MENGNKPEDAGYGSTDNNTSESYTTGENNNSIENSNRPEDAGHSDGEDGGVEFKLEDTNKTASISVDLKKSLAYMGNEEKLAYEVYMNLGTTYSDIKQFVNIATKSEIKHVGIVQDLVQRYDINGTQLSDENYVDSGYQNTELASMESEKYGVKAVQDLYDTLIAEATSEEMAIKVGCKIEVVDVNDLNNYITQAEDSNATDIVDAFNILRSGSYKHYWVFDKAMKKYNETGCYFEGDALLTNKEGIYPQD